MEKVYIVLGSVAWTLALAIGMTNMTMTIQTNLSTAMTIPHPHSGTVANGFAIGGGICFLASVFFTSRKPEYPIEEIQRLATKRQNKRADEFFEELSDKDKPKY